MSLNIYFSHSLNRQDYGLFKYIFNFSKEHGLEITFLEQELTGGIPEQVKEAVGKAALVLAFLSRRGSSQARVMEELEFSRRQNKKVLVIAERGLQSPELQGRRDVIPFDARYPIDSVKRSVSIVRDLRLKREDAERVKGLVGVMVFMKTVAFFSGDK
jgi:hypothetical protein